MLKVDYSIIFTVINLLVLFIALRIVFFKPVKKILEERQALIDQSFADAESAKAKAEELQQSCKKSQAALEAGREQALAEAQQRAAQEYDRIMSDAREKADELVRDAAIGAEREREEILRKAQSELTELVMAAATKVVVSGKAEDDAALYDQFLQKAGELDHDAEA